MWTSREFQEQLAVIHRGHLCAILVMIVVMSMAIVVILEARVWDDRGGEERGN
jgi:hypothetical protein